MAAPSRDSQPPTTVPVPRWPVGAAEWTLAAGSTAAAIERVARAGLDAIELTARGSDLDAAARRALAATGVRVTALLPGTSPDRDFADPDPVRRRAAAAHLRSTLALATDLDVPIVVVVPSDSVEASEPADVALQRAADTIGGVLADARPGPRVAIEPLNRYETHLVRTLDQGARLLSMLQPSRACLLADFFHMNIEETSIAEALRQHARLIGHVHVAENHRRRPGTGSLDFPALLAVLTEVGYAGALGLECVPSEEHDLRSARAHLARSV